MRVNHQARAAAAERRRARTRAQLIDAAMRVIAEKGPAEASITAFAAEAGVSRGVFYNYFPTQEDLILAVWRSVWDQIDREIIEASSGVEDPAEKIARSCLAFIDRAAHDPVRAWIWLRLDTTPAMPDPRMAHHLSLFHADAVRTGRLRAVDLDSALYLVAGAMRMAVRMVLVGASNRETAYRTVGLILVALGLDHVEADGVVSRWRMSQASC